MIGEGGGNDLFSLLESSSDVDNQSKIQPVKATGGRKNKKTKDKVSFFKVSILIINNINEDTL